MDEIIVSTFPQATSGWLRRDVIGRIRKETKLPVHHVVVERAEAEAAARALMATLAHAHEHDHHGPPAANVSSRVDARLLGIYLFIASEIMLFGSFFTALLLRAGHRRRRRPGRPSRYELPVYLALVNTIILVTSSFTMHWALQSIKRNYRAGLIAGLTLTFLLGLTFLLIQAREYTRLGFAPERPRLRARPSSA